MLWEPCQYMAIRNQEHLYINIWYDFIESYSRIMFLVKMQYNFLLRLTENLSAELKRKK